MRTAAISTGVLQATKWFCGCAPSVVLQCTHMTCLVCQHLLPTSSHEKRGGITIKGNFSTFTSFSSIHTVNYTLIYCTCSAEDVCGAGSLLKGVDDI